MRSSGCSVLFHLLIVAASNAALSSYLDALDFTASRAMGPWGSASAPGDQLNIAVGVSFEHLFSIDQKSHTYTADFWVVYRWHDARNYTSLFHDSAGHAHSFVRSETNTCSGGGAGMNGHGRQLSNLASPPLTRQRYVEFSHSDLSYVWKPDLQIRNARSKPMVHAELFRLYEDGTFEQLQLVYGTFELHHPFYGAYPFDKQLLTVMIESFAHSTQSVTLSNLDWLSGVNIALTEEWPGWEITGDQASAVHASVDDVAPNYASFEGNEHRCEQRARYHLDIKVSRVLGSTVTGQFLPLILIVIVTWTAFCIKINVLMPRIAVGFISFLTLSNMASSFTAALPAVSYDMWITVFFMSHRLFIILSLFETATCVYVTDHISSRVGMMLDQFARLFIPLDYLVFTIYLFAVGTSDQDDHQLFEERVNVAATLSYVNAFLLIGAGAIRIYTGTTSLKRQMDEDPLAVHKQSIDLKPLDDNEVRMLFRSFDVDGNGIITIDEFIARITQKNSQLQKAVEAAREEMLKAMPADLTLSKFMATHKSILDELDRIGLLHAKNAIIQTKSMSTMSIPADQVLVA